MTAEDRKDVNSTVLTYHRIAEAFQFAYAYRALLGDEEFWDVEEVRPSCKTISEKFSCIEYISFST